MLFLSLLYVWGKLNLEVFNNLQYVEASKWWSWDLDLPSEFKFLSTMFYLTYCVGYHEYIHLCNRFLVRLHFRWGNCWTSETGRSWGHVCCSEGARSPTGCNRVCIRGALSARNCGNTEEHDQICRRGRRGRHQVNFLEEWY